EAAPLLPILVSDHNRSSTLMSATWPPNTSRMKWRSPVTDARLAQPSFRDTCPRSNQAQPTPYSVFLRPIAQQILRHLPCSKVRPSGSPFVPVLHFLESTMTQNILGKFVSPTAFVAGSEERTGRVIYQSFRIRAPRGGYMANLGWILLVVAVLC